MKHTLNDINSVIFPHSYLRERDLNRLFLLFGPMSICQPWFLNAPINDSFQKLPSWLKILRPPPDAKPNDDFMALLAEYRLWIKNNQDRGHASLLKESQQLIADESRWKIGEMIRQMNNKPVQNPNDAQVTKWHLLLHLARELEENRAGAQEMLEKVRANKSPLEEAIGEEVESVGYFEDRPQSENSLVLGAIPFGQIIEAWVGLFGTYLSQIRLLITLDGRIMSTISDYVDSIFPEKNESAQSANFQITMPDMLEESTFKLSDNPENSPLAEWSKRIKSLFDRIDSEELLNAEHMEKLKNEISEYVSQDSTKSKMILSIKKIPSLSDKTVEKYNPVAKLSGKIIASLEKELPYE